MAGFVIVSKVGCVVLMWLMVSAPHVANAAVSCGTVANDLYPCLEYVRNGGPRVPTGCCSGIKSLYKEASTPTDRQSVCNCLKQGAGLVSGVNLNLAANLPSKCGVKLPYKISPSTDCTKVKFMAVEV